VIRHNKKDKDFKLDLVYRLNYSADLVNKFLQFKLEDGSTISEVFTIEGIPFLDFFTAELAHIHLPQVFLTKKNENGLYQQIKIKLLKIRNSALIFF